MTIIKLKKARRKRCVYSVASALVFHRPAKNSRRSEDRAHTGEQEEKREYRFSLPSIPPTLAHISPHRCTLQCIAAGDAAKCDAAPFLGPRTARGRRAMLLYLKVGNGRRKSDIELRSRAREVVRRRGRRDRREGKRERESNNGHHGRADAAG